MNKLAPFFTLALGLVMAAAGCPQKPTSGEINGAWTCISIAKIGMLGEVKPTANVDIPQKMFGGNAGCNAYFSNLEIMDGGKISISGIGATKMACMDQKAVVESAFLDALQSASSFEIKDGKLVLSGSDGPVAVFSKN